MKRIVLFFGLALTLLASCASQRNASEPPPVFSEDANAKVFDSYEIYRRADTIRVVNSTNHKNFRLTVYGYSNGAWQRYGVAELADAGDTDFIDRFIDRDARAFRYFAITLSDFNGGSFDFDYYVTMSHHDLYITITSIEDF